MKVVAIGGKAFVTGFTLAGVSGYYVSSSSEALERIKSLLDDPQVGLIIVSDDIASGIRDEITSIRAKRATPLIYEVPAPGSKREKIEYRSMLRRILGV